MMPSMQFEVFFRAIHGQDPFPWQIRAAERLARREVFTVSVPTGLGKSALVDAAIWAAAQGAWRRIAFVVDRRIVVDAVHQRAQRIAARLEHPGNDALRVFSGQVGPMQVVRLRGGVFGDDDWVLYPDRLTVALTTVDQLGSRLMFRGYGVSPRRWSMHAGFFGAGTLVIVDEAHLSEPFLQTLQALRDYGADIALLPMSATLNSVNVGERLSLGSDDLALGAVLRRIRARKQARVIEAGSADGPFVQEAVQQVVQLSGQPGASRVALVVNRVATARRCHARLLAQGLRSVLLTGRVRPAERDSRLAEVLPLVEAGRERRADDERLVVVATQTIEVGADFDFDALVTEAAPLSALRQRFGRVDRLGERGESSGVILLRAPGDREDAVYGDALQAACGWLRARDSASGIDFGLQALNDLLASHPAPAEAAKHAATLLPTHVAMLAQTGPYAPDVDLSAWLHGASDHAPDVTLVWRDDLDADSPEGWARAVQLLPPMLREGLPMPASAVRRWLSGAKPVDEWGDAGPVADDAKPMNEAGRSVLRWRGPDDCEVIDVSHLRPGDTLVLPASYGGCDEWGWAPESTQPVTDLADTCLLERLETGAARRPVLRLAQGHWSAFGPAAATLHGLIQALQRLMTEASNADEDLSDAIEAARQELIAAAIQTGHPLATAMRSPRLESHPGGFVLRENGVEELEGMIETGRAVALDVHHADVGRWAAQMCQDEPQRDAIVAAAVIHDAGKAEPRMQALLHGSPLAAAGGPLLAKSALRHRDQQVAAWAASGVPRGFRHELASLEYAEASDPLVRHLVGTHHGFARPWVVPCADPGASGAAVAALGSPWLSQWHRLLTEHGPWALSRMEWRLRAADARASIEEAQP